MKKTFSILAAGAAFIATPALACEFEGQRNFPVAPLFGDASATGNPVSVEKIADEFVSRPEIRVKFEAAGCTAAEMKGKIIALNGGNPAELRARSSNFIFPTLKFLAPAVAQPAPAASAAPQFTAQAVVQPLPATTASAVPSSVPAAAPAAAPVTPVVAPRTMEEVRAPIRAARVEVAKIEQKPVAERSPEEVSFLKDGPGQIAVLQTALRNLPATGPVPAALTQDQVNAINSVATLKTDLDSLKSDMGWVKIALAALAFIMLVLAARSYFRNRDIDASMKLLENDESLTLVSKKVEAFRAEVGVLTKRVTENEEATKNISEQLDVHVIELEAGWETKLAAATIGATVGLEILFDGTATFAAEVEKDSDSTVLVKTGIKGVPNAVNVSNLLTTVRKACKKDNFRLTNRIGGLAAVA